jgi:hypothetical protein
MLREWYAHAPGSGRQQDLQSAARSHKPNMGHFSFTIRISKNQISLLLYHTSIVRNTLPLEASEVSITSSGMSAERYCRCTPKLSAVHVGCWLRPHILARCNMGSHSKWELEWRQEPVARLIELDSTSHNHYQTRYPTG